LLRPEDWYLQLVIIYGEHENDEMTSGEREEKAHIVGNHKFTTES